jgi:hypothetical protein
MKVFISYSSRDRVEAFALKALIERQGHDAWMDVFDIQPAAKLATELGSGVQSVDVLCILLSPTSVASRWVQQEIEHARQAEAKGVKLLPVLLRPTAIPESLKDIVAIDATRGLDDPAVDVRLQQFFGGNVPEGVRLDAFNRSELADRAARDNAEAAFPSLREQLERVWDQPLRELTLEIDHAEWPDDDGSQLEIVIDLDFKLGSARFVLAPFVEAATWPAELGLDERPPEEFFASDKPRVDARFLWVGRELQLTPHLDGTDLGELPLAFSVSLDGEDPGTDRVTSGQLVERFELPPLRWLVDNGSRITLWRRTRNSEPVALDRRATDLEIALHARVDHDGLREVCLWRSRHDRTQQALLLAPTLAACASDLERDVLLDAYHRRPLREQQTSPERKQRIRAALEARQSLDVGDRWAGVNMLAVRAHVDAGRRGGIGAAATALSDAVNLVIEGFSEKSTRYEQFFALWKCVRDLVHLLARGGEEAALRHYLQLHVELSRAMHAAHPVEPDYARALAQALALRAEVHAKRFGQLDADSAQQAIALLDSLAQAHPLPWRLGDAEEMRVRLAKVGPTPPAPTLPPVYSRWLDPGSASDEVPTLVISALPTYSAKVSAKATTSARELHLVADELVSLHVARDPLRWFSVGCREAGFELPFEPTEVVKRPALALLYAEPVEVLAWHPGDTGDIFVRLHARSVQAARAVLTTRGGREQWRVYLIVVNGARLCWTISLGWPLAERGWRGLVSDDAAAAITFRSLKIDS